MSKIYLVWSGSYSAKDVVAAFTDKVVATALADKTPEGWTSECELDADDVTTLLNRFVDWGAVFSLSGDLIELRALPDDIYDGEADNYESKVLGDEGYHVYFQAPDSASAKKAAPDELAHWLAKRSVAKQEIPAPSVPALAQIIENMTTESHEAAKGNKLKAERSKQ